MACPFLNGTGSGAPTTSSGEVNYTSYLHLKDVLQCQVPLGRLNANGERVEIHDEHLFIVTHQAYELWFKQILLEIDSIRNEFINEGNEKLDEGEMLKITTRLHRINLIMKLLVDQFAILETMSPLDFMDFRGALQSSSGFQSIQFRLLENKLGVKGESRTVYNRQHYLEAIEDKDVREVVRLSAIEPSLAVLVERWLERTPGLEPADGFDFLTKYREAVHAYLQEEFVKPCENCADAKLKDQKMAEYQKWKESFASAMHEEKYQELLRSGDHRFSYRAFLGAMMIALYRHEPRFHQPYQLLTQLTDLDALLNKWRFFHVSLVQRMIGNKMGTGGSSGFVYLRSTVSDRYKAFLDLFNLSTYLVPREYIPPLTDGMAKRLTKIARDTKQPRKTSSSVDAK